MMIRQVQLHKQKQVPTDPAPDEAIRDKLHFWHSFFSEKDNKYFYFDPVHNVSTWHEPDEIRGQTDGNGERQQQGNPLNEQLKHQQRTSTTMGGTLKDGKLPATKTRGLDVDEKATQGTLLNSLKQRFHGSAKRIQIFLLTLEENPYPSALLGIAVILVVIKLFVVSRHFLPFFAHGTALIHRDQQQPIDILRRVEESFQTVIGDKEEPLIRPERIATKFAAKNAPIAALQEGQEILQRVELARNADAMEEPKMSWSKMKNAAKEVEQLVIL